MNEVTNLQVLYETGKRLASYMTVSILKRKLAELGGGGLVYLRASLYFLQLKRL